MVLPFTKQCTKLMKQKIFLCKTHNAQQNKLLGTSWHTGFLAGVYVVVTVSVVYYIILGTAFVLKKCVPLDKYFPDC